MTTKCMLSLAFFFYMLTSPGEPGSPFGPGKAGGPLKRAWGEREFELVYSFFFMVTSPGEPGSPFCPGKPGGPLKRAWAEREFEFSSVCLVFSKTLRVTKRFQQLPYLA